MKKLYEFNELSEKAKERAREDIRYTYEATSEYWDTLIDWEGGITITKEEMKLLEPVIDFNKINKANDGSYYTFFGTIMDNEDIVTKYTLEERHQEIIFAIKDKDYILEEFGSRIIDTFIDGAVGIVPDSHLDFILSEQAHEARWFDENGKEFIK